MRVHVVVVGDKTATQRTPDGVRRVDATDVGRLAMDVPDDGLPVILLAELRHAGAAGREAALLAQRTGVPGVARRMLPHGPLALHHLAVALAAAVAARDLGAAVAVELLDRLAAATLSAAWLASVSALDDPPPSVSQHVRSLRPGGAGFVVLHAPDQAVHALRSLPAAPGPSATTGPTRRVLLVSGQAPAAAVATVARLAGALEVRPVDPEITLRTRYGTNRGAELAALPDDVAALLPAEASLVPCPTCALHLAREICPFCHTSRQPVLVGRSR